jgi:hypothetical protein
MAWKHSGAAHLSRHGGANGCGRQDVDEILAEYPYLEAEDVKQALAYSAALAENEYHLWLRPSA